MDLLAFKRPFYSYGLSDARWNSYSDGAGIAPEVWLINVNDGGLGLLVVMAAVYHSKYGGTKDVGTGDAAGAGSLIVLVLVVLFRDATLWRETVEYMVSLLSLHNYYCI